MSTAVKNNSIFMILKKQLQLPRVSIYHNTTTYTYQLKKSYKKLINKTILNQIKT